MLPRNGVSVPRSRDSKSWMDVMWPVPAQAMPVQLQCRGKPPPRTASPAPTVQLDSAPSGSAVTPFLNASNASSCTDTDASATATAAVVGAAKNNASKTARTGSNEV